jgi:uridine kinase
MEFQEELMIVRLSPIFKKIEQLLLRQDHVTIAIEGRCAAGKTTTAKLLAERFRGEVIHMDDFFLPPTLRTAERYQEPGGNIHYERFREEVINHLGEKTGITYRSFDCKSMKYSGYRRASNSNVLLIEGAYSMHPRLTGKYDITIFVDVEKEEEKRRILERNGLEMLPIFENKWIVLEDYYIEHYHIKEQCEFILLSG